MSDSAEKLLNKPISRRSFLKWSAAIGGTTALAGGVGYGLQPTKTVAAAPAPKGEWRTAACAHACGGSRCLIKAYVENGVPTRLKTDDVDPDSPAMPQHRACPRGRAQISHVLSSDRLKYPMKRKNWAPGGGKKELRGKDEWIRISWDEALDILASETRRIKDKYGMQSIFAGSWSDGNHWILFDPVKRTFAALGGYVVPFGTVSYGGWPAADRNMTGTFKEASDRMDLTHAKLIVSFGNNWTANKGGMSQYYLEQAKYAGAKIIIVDPLLNQTAQGLADEWIPVRPGTDTALFIGITFHMVANNLQDQAFLDKYCSGFDKDHMPAGALVEDNYKDYVLGTYDKVPKTPEWASQICGVPPEKIRDLATQIATVKPASIFAGQSVAKIPAGEQVAQAFFTMGWMTGNVGLPGSFVGFGAPDESTTLLYAGTGDVFKTANALMPEKGFLMGDLWPFGHDIASKNNWVSPEYNELWQSILDGKYGRDNWPGGKRPLNIQMIYHGNGMFLNSAPNVAKGIEVHRKVEFVAASVINYNNNAKYADLVFPISTYWERQGFVAGIMKEHMIWYQQIMEPLFEAKPDMEVAKGLAKRMGLNPDDIEVAPPKQKEFNTLASAQVMKPDKSGYEPLVTITAEDIQAMGVTGKPQQGRIGVTEFRQRGIFKLTRSLDDKLTTVHRAAFRADPVKNPLKTASGKLEIYCPSLVKYVESFGFSKLAPIAKWQEAQDQGYQAAQRSKEYPLILFTPHTLRRAHTGFDSVVSLREAYPQECHMSSVDAQARGIKNGDVVLLTSPIGKVLRRAKVTVRMVPGAVALEDGAWFDIDETTGIDRGGCPNVLQSFPATGEGLQPYTGTLVQVVKYAGELIPDKLKPARQPKFAG